MQKVQQLTPKFENFTNSDSLSLCVTFPLLEDCSGLLNAHKIKSLFHMCSISRVKIAVLMLAQL